MSVLTGNFPEERGRIHLLARPSALVGLVKKAGLIRQTLQKIRVFGEHLFRSFLESNTSANERDNLGQSIFQSLKSRLNAGQVLLQLQDSLLKSLQRAFGFLVNHVAKLSGTPISSSPFPQPAFTS